MAELKFICPHCNQKISCDELWGGHQLQCPSCQREVTVPQNQAAPAPTPVAPQVRVSVHTHGSAVPGPPPPPPSAQPKLSLGRPQHAQQSDSGAPPPPRSGPVYRAIAPPVQKKGSAMKWVTITAVVAVLGVGGYFGFGWFKQRQEKANAKQAEIGKIAAGSETRAEAGEVANAAAKPAEKELPVIPAVWTLELDTAKIPEGRANGKISGTNFVVEIARLDIVGYAHVLSLRQGAAVSPDREILVYLHPKAGEALAGHTWTVSKDMKGPSVPQVAKRWKTNPKFAPTLKSFTAGYAMKLELGPNTNSEISGKIFLALPDAEHSVVAGVFKAATGLAAIASPTANPAAPTPAPVSDPAFQKRYGIKR